MVAFPALASVRLTTPPSWMLAIPPASLPRALPAPSGSPSIAHPFTIDPVLYNQLLSPTVPITIALLYATIVTYVNKINAEWKYQPWSISRTRAFKLFVLSHNIFLALYSAWTAVGMINAVRLSWPGLEESKSLSTVVDSFCKIHGVYGLGNAATYSPSMDTWGFTNRIFHLAADGLTPETTDVGRIWNEGLAFYGWLFYLSKFYEVVDTFIILAKGKRSSFLQTYHHAGAMLCMWAGIRYMSPPIWMFVTVNSSLHALMYLYYALTGLGVKVPRAFKKTLTSLQITQFVVGATYAFAHLFVEYQLPITTPYIYHLGDIAASVSSDVSSALSVATAAASADLGSWIKKVAFRAAGREGLAENVVNELGQTFGIDAAHAVKDLKAREEIRFRNDLQWVHCLDTSGQAFAILLNCMYLAPLTWLFLRFFTRAYSKRQARRRSSAVSDIARYARDSSFDAMKGVSRNIVNSVEELDDVNESAVVDGSTHGVADVLHKNVEIVVESAKRAASNAQDMFETVKTTTIEAKERFEEWVEVSPGKVRDTTEGTAVAEEEHTEEQQQEPPKEEEAHVEEAEAVQTEEPQPPNDQVEEAQPAEPPAEDLQPSDAQSLETKTEETKTGEEAQPHEEPTADNQSQDDPSEATKPVEGEAEDSQLEAPQAKELPATEEPQAEAQTEEPEKVESQNEEAQPNPVSDEMGEKEKEDADLGTKDSTE